VAVSLSDILRTTGSQGQRKGLEPYDGRIIGLVDFKIEEKGRGKDKNGNPKAKRRVLTAQVNTVGLKSRRARIPVRLASRFMEAIELRADDAEPFAVQDVLVKAGEHGATLLDPHKVLRTEGGWMEPADHTNGTGEPRKPGRPRRKVVEGAPA
jgi:hypothetical protein